MSLQADYILQPLDEPEGWTEGVQFTDGAVALRWCGDCPTTTVWDSIG